MEKFSGTFLVREVSKTTKDTAVRIRPTEPPDGIDDVDQWWKENRAMDIVGGEATLLFDGDLKFALGEVLTLTLTR